MKKIIRIIAVVLCIAILGVLLCSCQYLDDKKDNTAYFTDKNMDSLTFRGYTYKKMEIPSKKTVLINDDSESAFAVTDDIPILLSKMFGQEFSFDHKEKNPTILQFDVSADEIYYSTLNIGVNYKYSKGSAEGTYVREDQYDELKKALESAKLDHYYFWSWINNSEYYYDTDWESYDESYTTVPLDDKLTKAINDTLKNGKRVKYTDLQDDGWNAMDIYPCDKDMTVTDNRAIYILTDNDNNYYLLTLTNGSWDTDDLIKVDQKYDKRFDQLMLSKDTENQFWPTKLSEIFYPELSEDQGESEA